MRSQRLMLLVVGIAALVAAVTLAAFTLRQPTEESRPAPRLLVTIAKRPQLHGGQTTPLARHQPPATTRDLHPDGAPADSVPNSTADSRPGSDTLAGGTALAKGADVVREQPWVAANPAAPGHQLAYQGREASIEAYQARPASHSVALSVVISAAPPTEATSIAPASQPAVTTHAPAAGWTYEQQLFRTKWGWLAFDQMQLALRNTSD
ncbi:MAG: hypothetical protein WCJ14_07780 [Verrucomicrobiota bacterium]